MRLSIKTSLLLFWLVCILLIAAPQSSANQCAEGSTASDTLHIPCLVSEDSLNWFGTEPGPSGLLEMINSGHTETMGDLTECASFDVSEDILYIPCYSSGDAVYWFDLKRSSSLPYTFQLHDYGQMNSFSEHFITDNSAMWTKSHYWNGGDLLSTFRSDHLNFRDGIMELRLDNVPCGNDQLECNGQSYASGEYETTSLYGTESGCLEGRLKAAAGDGVITGLFTYTGEDKDVQSGIDIEFPGVDTSKMFVSFSNNGNHYTPEESPIELGFDASRDFHTYAVQWTVSPPEIRWYVDKVKKADADALDGLISIRPAHIIANLSATRDVELDEDLSTGAFNYTGPVTAEIDWIKYKPGKCDYEHIPDKDATPPSPPTDLILYSVSSGRVDLSWSASSDNVGVAGYKVHRDGVFIKSIAGTSASDTGLSEDTNYCYGVSAYDAAGNESENTWPSCITTLPKIAPIAAGGYWKVYHTETSGKDGNREIGPEYWLFNQSGNSIDITFSLYGHASITGSINGPVISFSWIEKGENVNTLTGTVDGRRMEGTYAITSGDSGIWRAEKLDPVSTDKQLAVNSAHAECHRHNDLYAIEAFVTDLNRVVDSVVMISPDMTTHTLSYEDDHRHWWNREESGAIIPDLPLNYNFEITFNDTSRQVVTGTVTKCVKEE